MLIEFGSNAWLVGLAILAALVFVLRGRGRYYLFFFSIFWVYILILVSVTVFPIPFGMEGGYRFKTTWDQILIMYKYRYMNLVPLYFNNCWDLPRACASGIYENILMTVPFGFGINFITSLKKRDIIWLAFAVGLVIESTQLILDLALGGAYRTVDANDVLFNGLGVWLGYALFLGFGWIFMAITRHFKIRQRGLLAYIQNVSSQTGFVGTAKLVKRSSIEELDK